MAENSKTGFLKIVLIIYAVVCLVYGLGYLIVPDLLVSLSGGDPVFHGWLRWSGGILIALGIGAILVFLKPKGQGIFVTTMALGTLLAGLALLLAWVTIKEEVNAWFAALPTIIVLGLSCLLWWSRQQTKDILYPKTD
jgi:peptidoglycan/LPS O-acetylase OafA/YrhL